MDAAGCPYGGSALGQEAPVSYVLLHLCEASACMHGHGAIGTAYALYLIPSEHEQTHLRPLNVK